MKLLLSILIAASAIFPAQAQRKKPHDPSIQELNLALTNELVNMAGRLDSLYRFVHTDRPAVATVADMLIFKTRLMQYVTDMQKRDNARIDSLVNSIKYEMELSRFNTTIFNRYLNKADSLEKRIKFLEKIPIFPGPDAWDEEIHLHKGVNGDDAQPAYPSQESILYMDDLSRIRAGEGIKMILSGSDSTIIVAVDTLNHKYMGYYKAKKPVKIIKRKPLTAISLTSGNLLHRQYNPDLTWIKVPGKGMYTVRLGQDTFFTYRPHPQKNYVIDASPGGYIKMRVQ